MDFLVQYGGGIGPDVWDEEIIISAVDIRDALNQAEAICEEFNGIVFSIDQSD